jgi:hypothetical protein
MQNISSIACDTNSSRITQIEFDAFEQIVWIAFESGRYAFLLIANRICGIDYLSTDRYAAFYAGTMMQLSELAILAAHGNKLTFIRRTGTRLWSSLFPTPILSIVFTSSKNSCLISTTSDSHVISLLDGSVTQTFQNTPYIRLKRTAKVIVCGMADGYIILRDPRYCQVVSNSVRAHQASIIHCDAIGGVVATTGYSLAQGVLLPDQVCFVC